MWLDLEGKEFNLSDYPDAFGFIYQIEYTDGRKYIGKRNFFDKIALPKNSNRKKKEVFLRESTTWRSYCGSHKEASELQIKSKRIIALGNTKRAITYLEVFHLMRVDAIFNPEYLNSNIGGVYFPNVFDPLKEPMRKEYR